MRLGNEDLKMERERRLANSNIWLTLASVRVVLLAFTALAILGAVLSFRTEPDVWIDHDSGCEYLRSGLGQLAPRTGPDGKQQGCVGN